ncbi:hypothetical protein BDZ88DRAFT_434935 [Geranomyces variabilis]|nr:hypothetical protein BDZ88DRAFT_434935 [Geranomyces variabilis]KAJ3132114.1 hypothetical protein HDU90_007547 [Geranomyces variabilis]
MTLPDTTLDTTLPATTTTTAWQALSAAAADPHAHAPLGRSSHSANVVGDCLYVFGGENVPRVPIDACLHVLDLKAKVWTVVEPTAEAPTPRVGHSTAVIGDKIYLFGGRSGAEQAPLDDFYSFDTAARKWTRIINHAGTGSVLPAARSYFSMASSADHIYLFGGCPASGGRSNDLYRYDPRTRIWEHLASHPAIVPRGGAGLAVLRGKVYLHGGYDGQHERDDLWAYDIASGKWENLDVPAGAAKPAARSVHGLAALNTRGGGGVIVCLLGERGPSPGGHVGAGSYFGDAWLFAPPPPSPPPTADSSRRQSGIVWHETHPHAASPEDRPSPRGWFPVAVWGDDKLIVHGGFTGETRDNGVYIFSL